MTVVRLLLAAAVACLVLPIHEADARGRPKTSQKPPTSKEGKARERAERTTQQRNLRIEQSRLIKVAEDALVLFRSLISDTKSDAGKRIREMSDRTLASHVVGLLKFRSNDAELRDLARLADLELNLRLSIPEFLAFRERYVEYVHREIDRQNASALRDPKSSVFREVREYAEREIEHRKLREDEVTVDHVDRWRTSERAQLEGAVQRFPLYGSTPEARSTTLLDYLLPEGVVSTSHERRYKVQALADRLRTVGSTLSEVHDPLQWRVQDSGSKLEAREHAWRLVENLDRPISPHAAELVYFLDQAHAPGAIEAMSSAWTARGRTQPRFLEHNDIQLLLAEFSGRPLFLVGHIEGRYFVRYGASGSAPLKIEIVALVEAAAKENVLLFPIGCSSAEAGAHLGFTRAIRTDEVSALFDALPAKDFTLRSIIEAFHAVGSVSIDLSRMGTFVDIVAKDPLGRPESFQDSTVALVRVPISDVAAPETGIDAYLDAWEESHRPWQDRGALRMLRTLGRERPITLYFALGFAFMFVPVTYDLVRLYLIPRRRLISRTERRIKGAFYSLGAISLGVAIVMGAVWLYRVDPLYVIVPALLLFLAILPSSEKN